MKAHSTIGSLVRERQCLKVKESIRPNTIPIVSDRTVREMKSPPIAAIEVALNSYPDLANPITALKRMIVTASFTTPSPRTTLNSFGCALALIIAMAAITSVEQINAHITSTSENNRFTGSSIHFDVSELYTY